MNVHYFSLASIILWALCILNVNFANGQQTTSFGAKAECPTMILSPSQLYVDFGKKATFRATIEASLDYPTEGRWQKIQNGVVIKTIDPSEEKYLDTDALYTPQLVINNAEFDDKGEYRLNVRISDRWCSSYNVRLQKVYGVLNYNARCNQDRECDERKYLRCSNQNCLCYSSYYPYNQECFSKSNLRASINNSNISETSIHFEWRHPTHSDLIQHYSVTISHNNGTTITSSLVSKQTSFTFQYEFIPGNRYYLRVTSHVRINYPSETFTVYREQNLVLAPLSPGLIDRHHSSFHPERLHLKWAVPINNTRVDSYSISISDGYSSPSFSSSSNNKEITSRRFLPGTNYTVTLYAISYGSSSPRHTEEIETLRTPYVTITPSGWPDIPYLSNLEVKCTIRNSSGFPSTLETKWQRNKLDFNISDAMYKGSSLDLFNPKLVINRIDFDRDDDIYYRCMAKNSEGWGSSVSDIRIDVKGSIKFMKSCNYSRECLYTAPLTCRDKLCLCDSSYYHKNEVCYRRNELQAQNKSIESTTCDISITWNHPSRNADLVTRYEVYLQEKTGHSWKSPERIYAGSNTEFTSPCSLQSGRLYQFFIRSQIVLSNPAQAISVDSSYINTVLEPRKPNAIIENQSNFSADELHLKWKESDGFVNRYRVKIDDHEQETFNKTPEVYWNQLLLPVTLYNVTITAISYGFSTNYYHFYGKTESVPATYLIKTSSALSFYG